MDLSSLPREKWMGDDYLVQIGGFWFLPQFVKKNERVINNYNPLPNDVILVTYPKSGTTWLKSLLYSILNRSSRHKLAVEHPHDLVPFLEAQLFAEVDEPPALAAPSDGPRLFATHLPYQYLTKTLDSSQCKVIYLTRNPKDLLVSFWHFVNKWNMEKPDQSWSLDEATDKFCDGVIPNGPYYDHVLEDPHGYVKKLGDFLGCPFEEEEEVDDIVKNCSFEMLSSYDVNKSKESTTWFPTPYNSFFRKGKVGDYENYLSNESIQRIDTLTKERFHSLGFMYGI
ncbi:hypothetical protein SASPL_134113 [Salvia splendens]|uniref:Sulfotransferase n=1 Tax=Salvia splendens TaxID=180675 RepID=A0A8X8X5I2_SALSN|nr:hypothetical protein SASPL_134113 [Salvia splendens]